MQVGKAVALGAVGVVLVAAGTFAVTKMRAPKPVEYLTAAAKMGDIEDAVLATGALQPFDVVNVGSEVSGQVVKVHVKLGDHVKKGDPIALINSQQLENQVRNMETQLSQTRSQLIFQNTQMTLNKANLERQQMLSDRNVGTPVDLERAKAQLAQITAQINQAQAQVAQRELEVQNAKNNLEKTNIRAPIDGLVAEVVAHEGTTINANQVSPTMVRLAKMDVMTVRAQVSEADIVKIRPGQKVFFTVLGDPNHRYYATLRMREVTPASGTLDPTAGGARQAQAVYYNALFEVPNEDGALLPAMTAEVHVVLGEAKNVLTIPSVSLGEKLGDHLYNVRVVGPDARAEDRKVTTGLDNRFIVEVKSGLKAGDKVVISEPGGPVASESNPSLFGKPAAPQ